MSPYFLLSILLGSVYGSAFHTWQGKTTRDILYYLIVGVIGFGLGQFLANYLVWQLYMIGPIHIIEASVCCWLSLFLARWLRI
jgi:uncharacterized membrane protein YeaQ/YmgE (transglycosylase-associated protein family)